MSKRLVILWDYYQHYHLARLAALHAAGAAQGWDVVGLAAGGGGTRRDSHLAETGRADVPSPVVLGGPDEDLRSPSVARQLADTLERLQPTAAILPGYGTHVARAGFRWCRRHRRGAVMIFETQEKDLPRFWLKEWLKRRLVRQADAVFCGGRSHAHYAGQLGMPPARIFSGYDAVDNDRWRETAARARQHPAPGPTPYFFAVGRFIPKKNFDGLVAAFARFKAADPAGWRLVIAGDGPERSRIEAEITRHRLGDSVQLPGYTTADETARWLAHAGVFVMPSAREEQWGLVVNEAMAAGTPAIVSTACGCVEDLVQEGVTGLRFDPASEDSLLSAMRQLAVDPGRRNQLAAAAQRHLEIFSLENFGRQALAAAECALAFARTR